MSSRKIKVSSQSCIVNYWTVPICFLNADREDFPFRKSSLPPGFAVLAHQLLASPVMTMLPSGNARLKRKRTMGPAIRSWNGRAIMKFRGILKAQIKSRVPHSPVLTQASAAPNRDMINTMGTTMQLETAITMQNGLDAPGFTRKRKAKPLASPETRNQSQHMANT